MADLTPTKELCELAKVAAAARAKTDKLRGESRKQSAVVSECSEALAAARARFDEVFGNSTDPTALRGAKADVDQAVEALREAQVRLDAIEQAIKNANQSAKREALAAHNLAERAVKQHYSAREAEIRKRLEAAVQDFLEARAAQFEWRCDESALYDLGILCRTPERKKAAVHRVTEMRSKLLEAASG
jgi:hypothetical protein